MVGLQTASELITFLLQTGVEWFVCLFLVRIVRSSRIRFRIWLVMYFVFAVQWSWMLAAILRRYLLGNAGGVSSDTALVATGQKLALSTSWANRISWILLVLASCYLVTLLGILLRTASQRVRLVKALRYKVAPSGRLSRMFEIVTLQVPSRDCKLWVLPGLASPATLGWWRPQIVVPSVCETLDDADLEAVFWHELTHVRRRDALWNALVRGCRNLLWFHPCVHHTFAAIGIERELACDRVVVDELPQSRDAYATCLVRFARLRLSSEGTTTACIELASGAAFLNRRIQSILTDAPQVTIGSSLRRAAASMLLVGVTSVLAPSLRILLTTARPDFAVVSTISRESSITVTHGKGHHFRVRQRTLPVDSSTTSVRSEENPGVPPVYQRQNPQLAAAHRVGIGIVAQYADESGDARTSQADISAPEAAAGARHSSARQPSWTAIAVSAAEKLGSIDFDHDHDRH